MRINEVVSPLKKYLATVRVSGTKDFDQRFRQGCCSQDVQDGWRGRLELQCDQHPLPKLNDIWLVLLQSFQQIWQFAGTIDQV